MLIRRLTARLLAASRERAKDERGQMVLMFVAVLTVIIVMAVLAVDVGVWFTERRGMARAVDLSALAAVQDLPADATSQVFTSRTAECAAIPACDAAYDWAERNGYGEATTTIEVSFFCGNDINNPPDWICFNDAAGSAFPLSACPNEDDELGCDTIRVTAEREGVKLFSQFFGDDVTVGNVGASAFARVEFIVSPVDLVISIDASGSMQGNPIVQAQIASKNFAEDILGDDPENSPSQVGYAPYRYCYDDDDSRCIPSFQFPPNPGRCNNTDDTWVLCLGQDLDLINEKIDATSAFEQTNVCLGLWASGMIMDGPNAQADVDKFIVILTDGANVFNDHESVPDDCWPRDAGGPDAPPVAQRCGVGAVGGGAVLLERQLDICTYEMSQDLWDDGSATGYEIYVVGLNVEGDDDPDEYPGNGINCGSIGNNADDDVADRRLLKCIASSTAGTNDHYFETDDANELPSIFQGIAFEISTRGLTGAP